MKVTATRTNVTIACSHSEMQRFAASEEMLALLKKHPEWCECECSYQWKHSQFPCVYRRSEHPEEILRRVPVVEPHAFVEPKEPCEVCALIRKAEGATKS